jgi:hypothetical protein
MTRGDYLFSRVHGSNHEIDGPFFYCIVLSSEMHGYRVNALTNTDRGVIHDIRIPRRFVCYQVNDVARIVELKLKGLTL